VVRGPRGEERSAFLTEWVERLIRLAGEIDSLGLWRVSGTTPEPLTAGVTVYLRRTNLPAYLSHQTSALLHRAREIARARRTLVRVQAGASVSPAELAAAGPALEITDTRMSHQLLLIIHDTADGFARFKTELRSAVEELVHRPEPDAGDDPERQVSDKEPAPRRVEVGETFVPNESVRVDGIPRRVTKPEYDLLRLLSDARDRGRGVTKGELERTNPHALTVLKRLAGKPGFQGLIHFPGAKTKGGYRLR
jgi:hypothetical protein